MRVGSAFVVCVVVASTAVAQTPPSPRDGEAAVRDVVRRYMDAREARDPRAIEALFTADADQLTTSGDWRRGRPAIVAGTEQASRQNPGARRITVESIRFVAPDVAIADGPYEIAPTGGGTARRMWATIVVVRESGAWRISAIRNMVPTSGQ
jgi:uncharacterized protein (TIGR02246 family)